MRIASTVCALTLAACWPAAALCQRLWSDVPPTRAGLVPQPIPVNFGGKVLMVQFICTFGPTSPSPMKPPFIHDCHLAIAPDRSPDRTADARIFLAHTGPYARLKSLDALQGKVYIYRAKDALDFVRLRTYPGCFRPVDDNMVEIVPRSNLRPEIAFGDGLLYDFLLTAPKGCLGILDDGACKNVGVQDAIAYWKEDHFEVVRYVVKDLTPDGPFPTPMVQRLTESVGIDGTYSCVSTDIRSPQLAALAPFWKFPHDGRMRPKSRETLAAVP